MRAYERLLRYVRVDTQSDENSAATPSSEKQFDLSRLLEKELASLGAENVFTDEHGYVYGRLPASAGYEKEPVIGLIAHLDTAPDFSGTGVRPLIHESYDGGDLPLGESGLVLSPALFPDLRDAAGQTLITTDGTTLLGADDKAGIAEIMTAIERLTTEGLPHCALAVGFTPDEEIGHGADLMDLERFGADFAYTVDGDDISEINFETFNAAEAVFEIKGVNVHPGSARGIMVNAALLACEISSLLPADEIPAKTGNYEGFFHLTDISGSVESASAKYIVRDHDAKKFSERCKRLEDIAAGLNAEYGEGTAMLSLREQYRNMAEALEGCPEIVTRAENAIRRAGLEPVRRPVRGGTDGSHLSFRGLPCPNLGTGGAAFHGPYEHITAENMDRAVEILLNIARG